MPSLMRRRRGRPAPATVISLIALAVSLGGTSYAAITVTGADVVNSSLTGTDVKNSSLTGTDVKNSSLTGSDVDNGSLTGTDIKSDTVSGSDIKTSAVNSDDVKDGSLRAADFRAGDLPQGAQGIQGPAGAPGVNGVDGVNGKDGSPDTPEQVRDKLKSVDGAGSQVDADLLDGVDLGGLVQGAGRVAAVAGSVALDAEGPLLDLGFVTVRLVCRGGGLGGATTTDYLRIEKNSTRADLFVAYTKADGSAAIANHVVTASSQFPGEQGQMRVDAWFVGQPTQVATIWSASAYESSSESCDYMIRGLTTG